MTASASRAVATSLSTTAANTFNTAAGSFAAGDRVGVPWLGWTDGECRYCLSGRENLCENIGGIMGFHVDGIAAETVTTFVRQIITHLRSHNPKHVVIADGLKKAFVSIPGKNLVAPLEPLPVALVLQAAPGHRARCAPPQPRAPHRSYSS